MLETLTSIFGFLNTNLITIVFTTIYVILAYALLRLHISPEYQKFDLASMVTKRDGSLDMGKFRVTVVFFATAYAFFYVLHNYHEMFISYVTIFTGLWLTHQVVDKVTRTDKDQEAESNKNGNGKTAVTSTMDEKC